MRNYVPLDDGQEPIDFDEYYDVPAETEKTLHTVFTSRLSVILRQLPSSGSGKARRSWSCCSGCESTESNEKRRGPLD